VTVQLITLACTINTFRPHDDPRVRWLDWDRDFEVAKDMWPEDCPLERETWEEARALGYRYCALTVGEQAVAIAAVWRYSEHAWEAAAVRTLPAFRRQGHGKAVVSYVTAHILEAGRLATCTTSAENEAMLRTAESVGYRGV
jgi:ribosomal protein S18 acetylase RimI-like enzyme